MDVDFADEEDADGVSEFAWSALETKLAIAAPGKLYVAEASNV